MGISRVDGLLTNNNGKHSQVDRVDLQVEEETWIDAGSKHRRRERGTGVRQKFKEIDAWKSNRVAWFLFFDGFWSRIARLGGGPVDGYVAPGWGMETGMRTQEAGRAGTGIMTGQSTSNPAKELS